MSQSVNVPVGEARQVQRLAFIQPYLGRLVLGFVVMLLSIGIQLSLPQATSYFIDNITIGESIDWLNPTTALMLGVFIIYCISTALRYYLFESTGALIVNDLRCHLFGCIIRQEIGFFDRHKTGELVGRLSSDVEMLKDTLSMNVAIGVRSLLVSIGASIFLIWMSPLLSLVLVLLIPTSLLLGRWLGQRAQSQSRALQKNLAQGIQVAQENISNVRLVQAFNQEKKAKSDFTDKARQALAQALANTRLFAVYQGMSTFVSYSALLVVLWMGGILIAEKALTIGELTGFILYAGMLTTSVNGVTGFWGEWKRSYGGTERVFELINRVPLGASKSGTKSHNLHGEVGFHSVSFSYPGRPNQYALKAFDLIIKPGEKVGLVGPSGAGKSTIANLLLGFYEPTQGEITFDGIPTTELNLKRLRAQIAIVEQEPTLFSGTIAENIAFALPDRPASLEEITAAAKESNAHEFISSFPSGYQTLVGEKGVQLSGGQKQRIAIARAMLRDPKLLILDEATSALDTESETLVQQALDRLMQDRTTILIAHRYSSIAKVDRLVVLDEGQLVQTGAHHQLIDDVDGLYHKLMSKQAFEKETNQNV